MTGQERHEALTKRRCPVTKLNINLGEFESYCFSHGLRIHGPEKKKFKPLLPLALGALGALAGPAAIVAGVVSGMSNAPSIAGFHPFTGIFSMGDGRMGLCG
jgi:hypothetical protein